MANRVRERLALKESSIEIEQDKATNGIAYTNSNQAYIELNRLHHEVVVPYKKATVLYQDSFLIDLARECDCSIDYLLGWINEPLQFVEPVGEQQVKVHELIRLIHRCIQDEGKDPIEVMRNSNIMAYETKIDREVFEVMFGEYSFDYRAWFTTSYYILSRLAYRYNFNVHTVFNFLLQAEDTADRERVERTKENIRVMIHHYNQEFGTEFDETVISGFQTNPEVPETNTDNNTPTTLNGPSIQPPEPMEEEEGEW